MITESDLCEIFDCLDVEEYPDFAESIEANIYIPSKGYYRLWKTPFFRFLLDIIEDPSVQVICLMIPSQIGKSQVIISIALEYARRNPGKLVLCYCPTDKLASDLASEKLIPIAEQSPVYSENIAKNLNGTNNRSALTKDSVKFFNGSEVRVLGVGGKGALQGKSSPLVILDEYAAMKENVGGDLINMAKTRTTAESYGNRKVIASSTPLEVNESIHKLHTQCRQYTWEVPCPKCNKYQFLSFENFRWEKPEKDVSNIVFSDMLKSGTLKTYYECPHCQHKMYENEKAMLLNAGRMACSGNEHLSNTQISIHLNGLYSLRPWNEIAGLFIEALTDLEKMKEFRQQVLASPWEESIKTKSLKISSIKRSIYPRKVIPTDTYRLVAGIDVQHNRFYSTLLAYTTSKEIHLVDWSEEPFDPEDPYNPDSFPFKLLEKDFGNGLKVEAIMLDTGDQTLITMELARRLSRCKPIKGFAKSRYSNQYHQLSKNQSDLVLVPLYDTNELLETLITSKAFCVPVGLDTNEEIFEHLTNVVKRGDKYVDKTKGARTDYRDCIRYALSYIMMNDFAGELDQVEYERVHRKEIDEQNQNQQKLFDYMFGTDFLSD